MSYEVPAQVEQQYEGRWIAWDTVAHVVISDGETLEEAVAAAADEADRTGHLIWYHHVLPRETVIVGGL